MKKIYLGLSFALFPLSNLTAQGILNSEMTTMELFLREEIMHEDVEMVARFIPGPEEGRASYYADKYHGLKTASGERFDTAAMTCAHRYYPFGSMLKVTRLDNKKSVIVRVNDRGPFVEGRVVDVSKKPARQLGMLRDGTVNVKIEPMAGNIPTPDTTPIPSPIPPPAEPTVLGKGYFSIAENKYAANGFGVQIGSFTDAKTLFQHVDELKQKGFSPLMVHSGTSNNAPIFRLIVGPYKNKKDTASVITALKEANISGIAVDMKGLK